MPSMKSRSLTLSYLVRLLLLLSAVEGTLADSLAAQEPCRSGFEALQRKEIVMAVPLLEQCLVTNPSQIHPFLALCGIYQSQGRSEDLYRIAAAGLKRFPEEKRFYLTVGNHLGLKGSFQDAIRVFEAGHRRWPDDERLKEGLANGYLSLGLRSLDKNENEDRGEALAQRDGTV